MISVNFGAQPEAERIALMRAALSPSPDGAQPPSRRARGTAPLAAPPPPVAGGFGDAWAGGGRPSGLPRLSAPLPSLESVVVPPLPGEKGPWPPKAALEAVEATRRPPLPKRKPVAPASAGTWPQEALRCVRAWAQAAGFLGPSSQA